MKVREKTSLKRLGDLVTLSALLAFASSNCLAQENENLNFGFVEVDADRPPIIAECLKEKLEEVTGALISTFVFSDLEDLALAFDRNIVHISWMNIGSYAAFQSEHYTPTRPGIKPLDQNGSAGYYSLAVTKLPKSLNAIEDTTGLVAGFSSENSASGYMIPLVELEERLGVSLQEHFSEIHFTGSLQSTISMVFNGEIDIGFVGSQFADPIKGSKSGPLADAVEIGLPIHDLHVVWQSKPIPYHPIILSTIVSNDITEKIESVFVDLASDEDCLTEFNQLYPGVAFGFDATGFKTSAASEYRSITDFYYLHR